MFCKAITSRGTPCIASCKAGSSYCHSHDGRFDECPVCLEEVPHIHTLRCGHRLCVECFQRLTTDECPLCRRVCDRSAVHRGLIDLSELLTDLQFMSFAGLDECRGVEDWWTIRYDRPDYVDTVTRIVDISCSLHSLVFRQPDFLEHIFQSYGLPLTDSLPCIRRFRRCIESFRHRTGIARPLFTRSCAVPDLLRSLIPPSRRWDAHLDALQASYDAWQEERTHRHRRR